MVYLKAFPLCFLFIIDFNNWKQEFYYEFIDLNCSLDVSDF